MQGTSRQALLLELKAELTRRKERLLMSIMSHVPKLSGADSAIPLKTFIENIESTAKIGRWHPSDCLELAASKVADSASSLFNSCPNFHGKKIWQKFETTHRVRSKAASRCYECQGIGHFAKECPARRRRRGRSRNSPGKETRANAQDPRS